MVTEMPNPPRHQLIHERCDESKGVFQRGVKRSLGPISRIPGGDRVVVKVGVVQVEKVNDQVLSSIATACSLMRSPFCPA